MIGLARAAAAHHQASPTTWLLLLLLLAPQLCLTAHWFYQETREVEQWNWCKRQSAVTRNNQQQIKFKRVEGAERTAASWKAATNQGKCRHQLSPAWLESQVSSSHMTLPSTMHSFQTSSVVVAKLQHWWPPSHKNSKKLVKERVLN
jgi:hypothetical protein